MSAAESVNNMILVAIIKRKVLPADESMWKVIQLALETASKKGYIAPELAVVGIIEIGDSLGVHR